MYMLEFHSKLSFLLCHRMCSGYMFYGNMRALLESFSQMVIALEALCIHEL